MDLPKFNEFALEIPLYEEFSLEPLAESDDLNALTNYLESIKEPQHPVDVFCVDCQKESTFRLTDKFITIRTNKGFRSSGSDEIFTVELSCTRKPKHCLYFIFRVLDMKISKIGQHYSIADLNTDRIKKYRKVLDNERYKELSKAVGLASHGVGIGSFVYLRRIFEGLIFEAYENIKDEVNEGEFKAKRMEEKIQSLSDYLPNFLVENKNMYSILSVGIHSLSEDECLKYFDTVKVGIELILDEKIVEKEQKQKEKRIKKSLGKITGEINN